MTRVYNPRDRDRKTVSGYFYVQIYSPPLCFNLAGAGYKVRVVVTCFSLGSYRLAYEATASTLVT